MLSAAGTLAGQTVAVILAAVGAVLFGLAAVRQHDAVHQTIGSARLTWRQHVASALSLFRRPAWLIGTGLAVLGAGLHVVALAFAPITLVQPIGVLAVPTTVLASRARHGGRAGALQWGGVALSVTGIAALTVLLLLPDTTTGSLPNLTALILTIAGLLVVGLVVTLSRSRGRPLLRCIALAVAAAALFGLNSILLRTIGQILLTSDVASQWVLLTVAIVGIGCALPLGVWAMQTSYLVGSPQVVICCLTLMDPLTAVIGGRLLLHDGGTLTGLMLAGVLGCAAVAAAGVVLLSARYPAEPVTDPVGPSELVDSQDQH